MKTVLIDLSAIFRKFWHVSESEELNFSRRKTLGLVQGCYNDFDDVKICVDCPPYRRKEIYPEYKATRPEPPPLIMEELEKCKRAILEDGWALLTCQGAEADDIIATYCVLSHPDDEQITIYGADKDLLQIALSNVTMYDPFGRKELTAMEKLGVEPYQVVDCLSLMGDKSDNVPGVKGIGGKTAAALLKDFKTIDGILLAIGETPDKFRASIREKIIESRSTLLMARKLIQLDPNCEIVEEKLDPSETKKDAKEFGDSDDPDIDAEFTENKVPDTGKTDSVSSELAKQEQPSQAQPRTHIIKHEDVTYVQALEPAGITSAWTLTGHMVESGMFTKFRKREGILAVIMRGRSLGIDAITSLEEIHVVEGKTQMSAILMMGLCIEKDFCEYFEMEESTSEKATFATKRTGNRKETRYSFTIKDAETAELLELTRKGNKTNWHKRPATMLRWRCISELARMVYPDVVAGVYTPDEIENFDN